MSSTNAQIGFIAFRLTSVYLFIRALDVVSSFGLFFANANGQFRSPHDRDALIVIYLVWFILYLIVAVVFYKQAKNLSTFFLGGQDDTDTEISGADKGYVERIAYTIVGVYVLATTIPHFSRIVYTLFLSRTLSQGPILDIIATGVSLLIGMFLVFGAKTLQSIIHKARGI